MDITIKTALIGIPTFIITFTSILYYGIYFPHNPIIVIAELIGCIFAFAFAMTFLDEYFQSKQPFYTTINQ